MMKPPIELFRTSPIVGIEPTFSTPITMTHLKDGLGYIGNVMPRR